MNAPKSIWTWIPSLYFIEGIPYVIVMTISVMLFKRLGDNNASIALYTSMLYLPWVAQPLWMHPVERLTSARWRICAMQLAISFTLAAMAWTVRDGGTTAGLMVCFGVVAFACAVHENASDNLYAQVLTPREQGLFAGTRSKLYYIALIVGQGITLMAAGGLETYFRNIRQAWYIVFAIMAFSIMACAMYHLLTLPRQQPAESPVSNIPPLPLRKKGMICAFLFIILFVLPKALTARLNLLFFIDHSSQGGLGLSLTQIGFAHGTIGIIGLSVGSIIANNLVGRDGLRKWLWPCALVFTLPQLLYVYICWMHITHFGLICTFIFIEQFGYGFGLSAYMYFMLRFSQGRHERYHYTICAALMALGMMLPGMLSGWLQTQLGYPTFYMVAAASGVVTLAVTFILYRQIKQFN